MGIGNPKLRFIPNSWFHFHKFQKPKSETKSPAISEVPLTLSPLRKSSHFTRSLIDSPKKASRTRKPTTHKSNPSETDDQSHSETGDCVSVHQLRPIKTERDNLTHTHTHTHTPPHSTHPHLGKKKKTIGIGIGIGIGIDDQNVKQRSSGKCRERRANGCLSANAESSMASSSSSSVCSFRQQSSRSVSVRRSSNGSPRIRVRIHSPRFPTRIQPQVNTRTRKVSLSKKGISSKSLAVVKCSSNPERDFRESMMEMIVENKIKSSKDLEDLLACYLSLNSHQYHHLIIQAFTHIWFDLNNMYHKTH